MKNYLIPLLAGLLALSSCSTYSEWSRGTTGAYVGSMFGSIIGDIVGGHRGSDLGALIGGAAGAAIGVASAHDHDSDGYASSHRSRRHHQETYDYDSDIYYGNGRDYSYSAPVSPADYLEITNVVFADANNNRVLEGGETAYVTFDIANHSGQAIYNIAPVITCDNHRVRISPTATIAKIDAGRGMRYKATVCAQTNVRSGMATFQIGFAERGNKFDLAKTFRINVRR
ncbi:MAG: hypothetical protein Q4D23_02280 [Bacteroidales bacterium]|nr:hypothetical protein [Bacteroidales bacterium]